MSTNEYPRMIKPCDKATMLNLMFGLDGYTLCCGLTCDELNGTDFVAVPFASDAENANSVMEIGYIVRKNSILSKMGAMYVAELHRYLEINL